MATLASRLHSSCIAENVTPVQAGSTDAKLSFISQYGSAATLTPEKHTVTVNTNGTLTDATYPLASGTAANPTFSNAASSTVTLLDHVNPSTSAEPAFRYYAYGIAKDSGGGEYQDAAGNPYMVLLDGTATLPNGTRTSSGTTVPDGTLPANSPTTLSAVAPSGLGSADAKLTSAVAINLTVKPAGKLGNTTDAMVPATLTDTVVLRLTPVPSEGNLPSVSPCE